MVFIWYTAFGHSGTKNLPAHLYSKPYPVLVSCSFTTVLGFVGLLFVNHPGLVDMGGLAIGAITISVLVTLAVAFWWNSWLMRE